MDRLLRLSINMQNLFCQWNDLEQRDEENPLIPAGVGTLLRMFRGITTPMDDSAVREELREQLRIAEAWVVTIFAVACEALDQQPEPDRAINPYAVSLRPERWEQDGLYEGQWPTAAEAREQALSVGPPQGMGPPGESGLPDTVSMGRPPSS